MKKRSLLNLNMSSRTAAGKKVEDDALESVSVDSDKSSASKTSGQAPSSRRTFLARLLLLLVTMGAIASLAFMTHYDSDKGAWSLPEVRFR